MTHSSEVTNGSQKPGSTDVSAGVMTPRKKSVEPVRLALQARKTLGALYETVRRVCVEKKPTGKCCDKFVSLTHVSSWIKQCKTGTSLLNPLIQLTIGSEVSREECGRLLHLVVYAHQPLEASLL